MPIRCEIVSQDRQVFEGQADIVIVPGEQGEMGILPNHAPLLSMLQMGVVKVRYQGEEEVFTVFGGLVEVQPNSITILTDAAEHIEEIDLARAEEARRRAQELLAKGLPPGPDKYLAIEAALRRSRLRIDTAKRFRIDRRARPRGQATPSGGEGETS